MFSRTDEYRLLARFHDVVYLPNLVLLAGTHMSVFSLNLHKLNLYIINSH